MNARQVIFMISIVFSFLSKDVCAHSSNGEIKRGNVAFQGGRYDQAAQFYQNALSKDPSSLTAEYNLGTALYKKKEYSEAIEHLQKALLSDDPEILKKVRFNLGNGFYQMGMAKENSDLKAAIQDVERSLGYFEKITKIDPHDQDAQFNSEIARKELERLKKEQEEQNKQQEQKQQQEQQQQDPQQQQQQGSNSRDQNKDSQDSQSSAGSNQKNKDNDHKKDEKGQKDGGDQRSPDKQDGSSKNDSPKPEQQSPKKSEQTSKPEQSPKVQEDSAGKPNPGKNEAHATPQPVPGGGRDGEAGDPAQSGASTGGKDKGMMTPKEAQMFLDDYQRNEEPRGILYFVPRQGKDRPVEKDW